MMMMKTREKNFPLKMDMMICMYIDHQQPTKCDCLLYRIPFDCMVFLLLLFWIYIDQFYGEKLRN